MGEDSDDAEYGLVSGSRIGDYLLGELIGRGGMAFVFKASDERLGRRVALKILYPEYARDKLLRARFIDEPKAPRQLTTRTSSRFTRQATPTASCTLRCAMWKAETSARCSAAARWQ